MSSLRILPLNFGVISGRQAAKKWMVTESRHGLRCRRHGLMYDRFHHLHRQLREAAQKWANLNGGNIHKTPHIE